MCRSKYFSPRNCFPQKPQVHLVLRFFNFFCSKVFHTSRSTCNRQSPGKLPSPPGGVRASVTARRTLLLPSGSHLSSSILPRPPSAIAKASDSDSAIMADHILNLELNFGPHGRMDGRMDGRSPPYVWDHVVHEHGSATPRKRGGVGVEE
eukprot:scaffold670_cov333-Pavlova_lutheri.AAC.22